MTGTVAYTRMDTQLGEFVLAEQGGAITGGWFAGQKYFPDLQQIGWQEQATPLLVRARQQLRAYFAGRRRVFNLPVAPRGTPFQQAVWQALCGVHWGQTISYGELARRLGRPEAYHAVGAAVASNPVMVMVPCHRALGSDGRLVGYAGGLQRKRWLLDLESGVGQLFD